MTIGDRIPRHTPTRIETVFGTAHSQPVAAHIRHTGKPDTNRRPTSAPTTASGTSLQRHSAHPCPPR